MQIDNVICMKPAPAISDSIFREMMDLVQKQTEALEKQTFGGFTNEEMSEFEERQERIRELQSDEKFRRAA